MRNQFLLLSCAAVFGCLLAGSGSLLCAAGHPVDFSNDVMAVLSKAGCNQGTCHGNRFGKGGFKLSLRGQDPATDFQTITRGLGGRRVDRVDPGKSLILLKPSAEIPHEGGRRFSAGEVPFQILRDWIEEGLPGPDPGSPKLLRLETSPGGELEVLVEPASELRIRVYAEFSDGTRRDVSELAVYESTDAVAAVSSQGVARRVSFGEATILVRYLELQVPVRVAFVPAMEGYEWRGHQEKNFIDKAIFGKLRLLRMNPSEICDDTVFLRRATLDLAGRLPTSTEAREFTFDEGEAKRARKIDELLATAEFADFWALKWGDLLRNEEKVLDRKGVQSFQRWLRDSIARGKPLDVFAREILTARGSTYRNPPANYLRANRDVLERAENTAQVFLGVRLACAKCHNHPFERWTQDDYYGWAALFSRVRYKVYENKRRDGLDKNAFIGEQIVWMARDGSLKDPRDGRDVTPRLLGTDDGIPTKEDDPMKFLAEWVVSPENPFFARSLVNRIWFNLMGKGNLRSLGDKLYVGGGLSLADAAVVNVNRETLEAAERRKLHILCLDEAFEGAFPIGCQEEVRARVLPLDLAGAWSNQELGCLCDVLFSDSRSDIGPEGAATSKHGKNHRFPALFQKVILGSHQLVNQTLLLGAVAGYAYR